MQPNTEPNAADLSAVQAALDNNPQPAPQPQPQPQAQPQQQPAQPTQQPAPSQQQGDPFANLFASEPTEPTSQQPAQQQQPAPQPTQQPSEPTTQQPAQQPAPQPQPGQQVQPQQTPQQQPPLAEQVQTYEDYLNEVLGSQPTPPEVPDPSQIPQDDEAAIGNFFKDYAKAIQQQTLAEVNRTNAIQAAERNLWDDAFDKYGSLRSNKPLRDMVHAIRRAEFDKGLAITPTQAADRLLNALQQQYRQGVADNQVQTTIESVQPNNGGGTEVPTTMTGGNILEAVQTGGEVALTDYLDQAIRAGRFSGQ